MKILIVDDHVYNRDLLRYVLEDVGHECVEADNGLSAIRVFEEDQAIALLLMDINMPLMDGIEATRQICQLKGERNATIIFVTALDNADVLVRCLDAGGDDFVPKPINEAVLISKVNAHARNQDTFRRLQLAHRQLQCHQQNIAREHSVIERVFANGIERLDTHCQNLVSYSSPMSMFNGDLLLSAPAADGGEYVIIGDFTGHGLSAAIGSLPVMSMFYELVRRQASVAEMAREINRQLHGLLPVGLFFCSTILHLSRSGQRITLWSGGMNDAVVLDPAGEAYHLLPAKHLPLGIRAASEFDASVDVREMALGARVYIYTDGVNEAKNAAGEQFGEARIIDVLRNNDSHRVDALIDEVNRFRGQRLQNDDVSLLELYCGPCVHLDKTTGAVIDVVQVEQAVVAMPWQWRGKVEGKNLRRTAVAAQISDALTATGRLALHKGPLSAIISELYTDALLHGILRLDTEVKYGERNQQQNHEHDYNELCQQRLAGICQGYIAFDVEYLPGEPGCVHISVTASGDDPDCDGNSSAAESAAASRRGLDIVGGLCRSVEHSLGGRRVSVVYELT